MMPPNSALHLARVLARKVGPAPSCCDKGAMGRLPLLLERVMPVAVLVIAVVGAPVMIFSPQGLPRLRGLEKERSKRFPTMAALVHELTPPPQRSRAARRAHKPVRP